MNWERFWDQQAIRNPNPHKQVARTGLTHSHNDEISDMITNHIAKLLDINPRDRLLDVCCGNGVLTHKLAHLCHTVTAVDISARQLEVAKKKYAKDNITYLQANVLELNRHLDIKFDKINLYFSFQYLDSFRKGNQAIIQMLKLLNKGGMILLGDVPDHDHLSVFYPNLRIRLRYQLGRLLGRDQMGKFWKYAEMKKIATQTSCSLERLVQPAPLPYAHYRVDYIIRKTADIPE